MSMSMKGSGIYSYDVTLTVECACDECGGCGHEWDQDFGTNDWGNVDQNVTCSKCAHEFNFTHEADDRGDDDDYDRFLHK